MVDVSMNCMIVSILTIVLPTISTLAQQHTAIPTDVDNVFCAEASAIETRAVFSQNNPRYSGFVVKSFVGSQESTLCSYVVRQADGEKHSAFGVDPLGAHVAVGRSTNLGQGLGIIVYDCLQDRVAKFYPKERFLWTVSSNFEVITIDSTQFPDSIVIGSLNLLTEEATEIVRLSSEAATALSETLIVVGSRLVVLVDGTYKIYNISTGSLVGHGLAKPELLTAIRSQAHVVDSSASLLIYDLSTSARSVAALKLDDNRYVDIPVNVNFRDPEVRLKWFDAMSGRFMVQYRNLPILALFTADQDSSVYEWPTFRSRTFASSLDGGENLFVGTSSSVMVLPSSIEEIRTVAIMNDPVYIKFLGDDRLIYWTGSPTSSLYSTESQSVVDHMLTTALRTNPNTGFTYLCETSANGTSMKIDSINAVAAEEFGVTMLHRKGCSATAISGDRKIVLSVSEDSVYIYSVGTGALLSISAIDSRIGKTLHASASMDGSVLFLVGDKGATRFDVGSVEVLARYESSIRQSRFVASDWVKGEYYTDPGGALHFVFRPSEKGIGDYNVATSQIEWREPLPVNIQDVIVNEKGLALLVTSDAEAFWFDFVLNELRGKVDQINTGGQIWCADYSFRTGVVAYRTANQIIVEKVPVTGIAEGSAEKKLASESLLIRQSGNNVDINIQDGSIRTISIYTMNGELLQRSIIVDGQRTFQFALPTKMSRSMYAFMVEALIGEEVFYLTKIAFID